MRNNKRTIIISYIPVIALLLLSCVKPSEKKELLYEGDAMNMNFKTGEIIRCNLGKGPIKLKKLITAPDGDKVWSIYMKNILNLGD